jgi:DNA-binding CsgD family transcriptional regulator
MEKSTKVLMLTWKKLARGISISEIADALEETEETIRQLVNKLQQA